LTLVLLSVFLTAYADEQTATTADNAESAVAPSSEQATPDKSVEKVEKTEASQESTDIPAAVTQAVSGFLREDKKFSTISESVVNGLYEVVVGSEVFYISADGRHAVIGDIRDSQTGKNVTDGKRAELRVKELAQFDESGMVVFPSKAETKYTVNVFTDVDCGYCAKFHQGVEELGNLGIKVRYLGFPRAGMGSKTYNVMQSVWCADDRQKAMTDAKARRDVPEKKCDNPIKEHYELGQRVGVRGTPALLLSDGELLPGYVPPQRLFNYLESKTKEKEAVAENQDKAADAPAKNEEGKTPESQETKQ